MDRLAAYLDENNVAQAALAKLVGVDQSRISKYRRGDLIPTLPIAARIEQATGGAVPITRCF
jgi:transcriptional regulator with XRE-family HTH domain